MWCLVLPCSLLGEHSWRSSRKRSAALVSPTGKRRKVVPVLWWSTVTLCWANCHLPSLMKTLQSFLISPQDLGKPPEHGIENTSPLIPTLLFQPHLSTLSPHILEFWSYGTNQKFLPISLSLLSLLLKLPFSCPSELSYSFCTSQPNSHFLWEAAPTHRSVWGAASVSTRDIVSAQLWHVHVSAPTASSPAPWGQVCISFSIHPSASSAMFGINQANKEYLFRKYVQFEKIKSIKVIF